MRRQAIFWNVQRVFDPAGLPVARALGGVGDAWTRDDYARKLANLGACLRAMTGGDPPALLALAEVESSRVVADLCAAAGWSRLVDVDRIAPDPTLDGLDVALVFDPEVFDPDRVTARSVALDNRFQTRDLLDVRMRLRDPPVDVVVMVAHWPSRVIAEGEALRQAYSVHLRRRLRGVLQFGKADLVDAAGAVRLPEPETLLARWNTPCLILGDFNDEPGDPSVRTALGSTRFVDRVASRGRLTGKALREADNYLAADFALYAPCWTLRFTDDGAIGGTYYRGEWRAYDQLLCTHGALGPASPIAYAPGSIRAVRLPDLDDGAVSMATRSGRPRGFDRRAPHGVSDHFPLTFDLEIGG